VSFLLAFLGFALLIILHEAGHFVAAKKVGMRVERFSLFFPPLIWRKKVGETEYAVGSIPLGGYVKITGMNPHEEIPPEHAHRAYFRQPVWKRIVVIAAGPAVNIVLAFLILWALFVSTGFYEPNTKVDQIEPGAPAAGVLRPGDRLIAVDGVTGSQQDLAGRIQTHRCPGDLEAGCRAATPAEIVVQRGDRRIALKIAPVYDAQFKRMRVGFAFGQDHHDAGPLTAAELSGEALWNFTKGTVTTIAGIFEAEKRQEISGVVGSYEVTRQSIESDTKTALYVLAVISLSLGVINLFPFLPLDGGHIFWALAEKVRGKPIPFRVMEQAGFVGFALVIALFMIGLTNDIDRLTGRGFDVR
jgi:regulator of sigma E protease